MQKSTRLLIFFKDLFGKSLTFAGIFLINKLKAWVRSWSLIELKLRNQLWLMDTQ
jgi:hypothetical protein